MLSFHIDVHSQAAHVRRFLVHTLPKSEPRFILGRRVCRLFPIFCAQHDQCFSALHPGPLAGVHMPADVVEVSNRKSDRWLDPARTFDLVEGKNMQTMSGPFVRLVGALGRLDVAGYVQALSKLMGTMVPGSIYWSARSSA